MLNRKAAATAAAALLKQEALTAALFDPTTPRGFTGQLTNLRTPLGLATITSSAGELSIKLQQQEEE